MEIVENLMFMNIPMWLIFSIICIIAWGLEDVFLRTIALKNNSNFNLKIAVCTGVMGIAVLPYLTSNSESGYSIMTLILSDVTVFLACITYTVLLIIAFLGAKYLAASIYSPIENGSSGFEIVLILAYAVITGNYSEVSSFISPSSIIAMVLIFGGIIALAIVHKRINDDALTLDPQNKKYRYGVKAFLFPLLICIADALSTVVDTINLGGVGKEVIGSFDYMRLYAVSYILIGVVAWFIILYRTKKLYTPFCKDEILNFSVGLCEGGAGILYIFTIEQNAILSLPITNAYCIVTLILSRIFLKEKLTLIQKICVTTVIIGIIIITLIGIQGA